MTDETRAQVLNMLLDIENWMSSQPHGTPNMHFDGDWIHALRDARTLLRSDGVRPAGAQSEADSPVLSFQVWLLRFVEARGRKVTQDEYSLLQTGFFAAHPGKGPFSTFMVIDPAAAPSPTGAPTPPQEPPAFTKWLDDEIAHAERRRHDGGDMSLTADGWNSPCCGPVAPNTSTHCKCGRSHVCYRCRAQVTTLRTAWCQTCLDEAAENRRRYPPRKPIVRKCPGCGATLHALVGHRCPGRPRMRAAGARGEP